MDPVLVATAFCHGCDAGVALERLSRWKALSVLAEGYQQPGSENGSCARQGAKERVVSKRFADPVNFSVEACDGLTHGAKLRDQGLDKQRCGSDDGVARGDGLRGADFGYPLFDSSGPSDVVLVKEVEEGLFPCALSVFEGRPSLKEVCKDTGFLVGRPGNRLWEVGLERVGKAVGETYPIFHQRTVVLDHALKEPHVRTFAPKRWDLFRMTEKQPESNFGVCWIVFRARLGVKARRYLASIAGLTRNTTKMSCSKRAETKGPRGSSMAMALGAPPNRSRSFWAHVSMTAGR